MLRERTCIKRKVSMLGGEAKKQRLLLLSFEAVGQLGPKVTYIPWIFTPTGQHVLVFKIFLLTILRCIFIHLKNRSCVPLRTPSRMEKLLSTDICRNARECISLLLLDQVLLILPVYPGCMGSRNHLPTSKIIDRCPQALPHHL